MNHTGINNVGYAVEWNAGEGWKRLAQTKPTEKEAREYAEWVLIKDLQEYRIIEITEKILPWKINTINT
jgi:hypothetical protein